MCGSLPVHVWGLPARKINHCPLGGGGAVNKVLFGWAWKRQPQAPLSFVQNQWGSSSQSCLSACLPCAVALARGNVGFSPSGGLQPRAYPALAWALLAVVGAVSCGTSLLATRPLFGQAWCLAPGPCWLSLLCSVLQAGCAAQACPGDNCVGGG